MMKKILVLIAGLVLIVMALNSHGHGWGWIATQRTDSVEVTFSVVYGAVAFDRINCVNLAPKTLRCRIFVEVFAEPLQNPK